MPKSRLGREPMIGALGGLAAVPGPNIHAAHVGRLCRLKAQFGIFVDDARLRRNTHAFGCKQKGIGRRFAVLNIIGAGHHSKHIAEAGGGKLAADHVAMAAAGDGYLQARRSCRFCESNDRFYTLNFSDVSQVMGFLLGRDGLMVGGNGLLAAERFGDFDGRRSGQRVKTSLRQLEAMRLKSGHPGAVVHGHGVYKSAIKIKY